MPAAALTTGQLIGLVGLCGLLAAMMRSTERRMIRAIEAESEPVVTKFWGDWGERMPGLRLTIDRHHTSPDMRVVVVERITG